MKTILIRFGELYLKGNNRGYFERLLITNIKERLKDIPFSFEKTQGRYIVSNFDEASTDEIIYRLTTVFGIYSISLADCVVADKEVILNECSKIIIENDTFRVTVKRADKRFPINSTEFASLVGDRILQTNPHLKVNLYTPDKEIVIDIRENGKAYIFTHTIKGAGGLPLGCSGKALSLLSGGIDSPVASYLMSKRGLKLEFLHFHSFPYTSKQARDKVCKLAELLGEYCGESKIHIVSFTKIQEEIHKRCAPEFMITIMRRIMMRIAERICSQNELGAIVTGESLAQVASQTMQSITVTGGVIENLPVFRPLIGLDKEEIIEISKKINTYDTSILPYEDCCTVFLPKNPVIRPSLEKTLKEESKLDLEALIEEALKDIEIVNI